MYISPSLQITTWDGALVSGIQIQRRGLLCREAGFPKPCPNVCERNECCTKFLFKTLSHDARRSWRHLSAHRGYRIQAKWTLILRHAHAHVHVSHSLFGKLGWQQHGSWYTHSPSEQCTVISARKLSRKRQQAGVIMTAKRERGRGAYSCKWHVRKQWWSVLG